MYNNNYLNHEIMSEQWDWHRRGQSHTFKSMHPALFGVLRFLKLVMVFYLIIWVGFYR
jgi:hypothetical protein